MHVLPLLREGPTQMTKYNFALVLPLEDWTDDSRMVTSEHLWIKQNMGRRLGYNNINTEWFGNLDFAFFA